MTRLTDSASEAICAPATAESSPKCVKGAGPDLVDQLLLRALIAESRGDSAQHVRKRVVVLCCAGGETRRVV